MDEADRILNMDFEQEVSKTFTFLVVSEQGSVQFPQADHVKILGTISDCSLTMDNHTKAVSKSCFYHIH